jgi:CRISPR-associated protein Cmr1
LRFWFRFLEGARQQGDWRRVRREEQRLFGSTDTGTGVFRIRLRSTPPVTTLANRPGAYREWPIEIAYMGYGPVQRRKSRRPTTVFEPTRPFIDAGQAFTFDLLFDPNATADDRRRIYESLWAWTHLGGFGARARRGWGSLALRSPLDMSPAPVLQTDESQLETRIRCGIADILASASAPALASYSHWFSGASVRCPHFAADWQQAMAWIGRKFIDYRSNWSRLRGTTPGPCASDHDVILEYLKPGAGGGTPITAPARAAFGLPHNYTFSRLRQAGWNPYQASVTARVTRKAGAAAIDRRSSPLFVRLHPLSAGRVAVAVMFVPAALLPGDGTAEIQIEPVYDDRRIPSRSSQPAAVGVPLPDYRAVQDFFNAL